MSVSIDIHQLLSQRIRHLVAALDVTVEVDDRIAQASYIHNSAWKSSPPRDFLNEILSPTPQEQREAVILVHESLVAPLESPSGDYFGRAALWMYSGEERSEQLHLSRTTVSNVSVGGFVYDSSKRNFSYVGVLTGDTKDVTRTTAESEVPADVIAMWASRQAKLIDPGRFQIYDLVRACHTIVELKGDPQILPFCFSAGKFKTFKEFEALVSGSKVNLYSAF
jgi:hypothetical protein